MPTKSARRKLLFHIGHPKTGTTSIQYAFATGRVKLANGHILYPGRLAHNYLRKHFETYVREGRVLPGTPDFPGLATISEQLRRGNYDVAVLSGEVFEESDPIVVQRVLDKFMLPHVTDHAVICYIRPHAARTLSSFAERTKAGIFSGMLEAFHEASFRQRRFFYAPSMTQWVNVFGLKFRVRPMMRTELAGGDVLRDFIETGLGPDTQMKIMPGDTANESLSLEDLLVVKLVQDRLQTRAPRLRHTMGWELAEAFGAAVRNEARGTRLMLHRTLAERIRDTYRADAEEIDARFFNGRSLMRDELDRAVDEAAPKPQSFDPADYFSAEALRALSVLAAEVDRLMDHKGEPWPDFLLKKRIASLHGEANDLSKPKGSTPH